MLLLFTENIMKHSWLMRLTSLILLYHVQSGKSYLVGSGINVRFAQMLFTDEKYDRLRREVMEINTRELTTACSTTKESCEAALARTRYKPSKHFYALAKAVVDYVKNKRHAWPTGYVGTATFCQDNVCTMDGDPPIVEGGCKELISCGGHESWYLDSVFQLDSDS